MPLDLALVNFDQESGRYNFAKGPSGDVLFDTTQAFAVMNSCVSKKGRYWADQNHGSRLGELRNQTSTTASAAQAETLDAVQPLVDAGLITNVQASADSSLGVANGSQLAVDISWSTPGGTGGTGSVGV
jgi:phage gp46-like protein